MTESPGGGSDPVLAACTPRRQGAAVNSLVAEIPYLRRDAARSLHATGSLYIDRDHDGSDRAIVGVTTESRRCHVRDGRANRDLQLDGAGFSHEQAPLDHEVDFLDAEDLAARYLPSCERLVAEATGSAHVVAFDFNLRDSDPERQGARIRNGQRVQGPAQIAHSDYTLDGSLRRRHDLTRELGIDELRSDGGRWRIINVWRNRSTEPVSDHPIVLCDARTVDPSDLATFEIRYPHRTGENYFATPSESHRWWWFPALTNDEAVLLKQWDSHGTLANTGGAYSPGDDTVSTFSLHTAVRVPGAEGRRQSIEVRCIVIG